MVGIMLAYARLVGLRALDQHRTNRWQLSRPHEQNDIGPTHVICQRRANKSSEQILLVQQMIAIWIDILNASANV